VHVCYILEQSFATKVSSVLVVNFTRTAELANSWLREEFYQFYASVNGCED